MPGLIFNGQPLPVNAVTVVNYVDDPTWTLPIPKCGTCRRRGIVCVVLHTTGGYPDHDHPTPQRVRDEAAGSQHCHARAVLENWRRSSRVSGAHVLVDADGTCYCLADLVEIAAYHCVGWNQVSIGIEVVQQRNSSLFAAQLLAVGRVVDAIVTKLSLPRRVAVGYEGQPRGNIDGIGVVGHRDLSSNRGDGDPGDFIMRAAMGVGEWVAV